MYLNNKFVYSNILIILSIKIYGGSFPSTLKQSTMEDVNKEASKLQGIWIGNPQFTASSFFH